MFIHSPGRAGLKIHLLIVIEGTRPAGERVCVWERTWIIHRPDPLTQAAQHQCYNPFLSTSNSNKAFAQHQVCPRRSLYLEFVHTPYATCLLFRHTFFWVFVSYTTLQCHQMNLSLFCCCCLTSWQDYALSRGQPEHSYFGLCWCMCQWIKLLLSYLESPQTFPSHYDCF